MKRFKKFLIISILIIMIFAILLPLKSFADESLWILDGRPKMSGGKVVNIQTYDGIMSYSPDTLANTRYFDDGNKLLGSFMWWKKTNNVLCMHPSNNDFGSGKAMRAFVLIDINKSGNEPDYAEIYVPAGTVYDNAGMKKVATCNDYRNAELAYLCTKINADNTFYATWMKTKATFNTWWNSNYSYYGNLAGESFPNAGNEASSSAITEWISEAQRYGSNYQNESTQYQARVIIFGGGSSQRRGLVFGKECQGSR